MNVPANDPALRSWIPVTADSDFPIQNLPLGVGSWNGEPPVPLTRVGDVIVDLSILADSGLLDSTGIPREAFVAPHLNELMKGGAASVRGLRARLSELLRLDNAELRDDSTLREDALLPPEQVTMHLPVTVGDYTTSTAAASTRTNVGTMFRDPANALLPNWLHLPVGYHGRASSIIPSGVPVRRPMGQYKPDPDAPPVFGPTKQLDFELEVGFITYEGKPLGERISTAEAEDHILGLVLFNDWSARDIQAWEYVPLGPFPGQELRFSSISPWVVLLDALEPFRVPGPLQDPSPAALLAYQARRHFDIALEVLITTAERKGQQRLPQQLQAPVLEHGPTTRAPHGERLQRALRRPDGERHHQWPSTGSYGSMLELTWRGTKPLTLADGSERKFILDGDTVIMRGHA
jgi:fumarylacetoacetase